MWPELSSAFRGSAAWLWVPLAVLPALIVLLYFLKLKRRPLEVPSTYLWHKSIEDLHVNALWQRLRRNLLLLLQLLLLALVALALLRPHWQGRRLLGERFIFMIDNSASMQATDVGPTRLDEARRRVADMIEQMDPEDVAMIVSFADSAQVVQPFTRDRRLLRESLQTIAPTDRPTSLTEALRVASGLANPGRLSEAGNALDVQVAEPLPADLYIFSDGKFPPVAGFSLGNLKPTFVPIGSAEAHNVGIMAFSVRRHPARPELYQAFARLNNFGTQSADVGLELHLDDELIDADRLAIPSGQSRAVVFDLGAVEAGVLTLKAETKDHLGVDDRASVVIQPPARAEVLLVTLGNEPLELALSTEAAAEISRLRVEPPAFLKSKEYGRLAEAGAFDLVIYDRCSPEKMPPANTVFLGALPPGKTWSVRPVVAWPQVIDVESSHPLMQWVDFGDVEILDATPLEPPDGATELVDSGAGPLVAVGPRQGFEDLVLGFVLIDQQTDDQGNTQTTIGTNWPIRASFPLFVLNMLDYLAGGRTSPEQESLRPGRPIEIEPPSPGVRLQVQTPWEETVDLQTTRSEKVSFTATDRMGVYGVLADGKPFRQVAVNLFDPGESAIRPDSKPVIQIGYVEVEGEAGWEFTRREAWKLLLAVGVGILLLEWYIYTRRVGL